MLHIDQRGAFTPAAAGLCAPHASVGSCQQKYDICAQKYLLGWISGLCTALFPAQATKQQRSHRSCPNAINQPIRRVLRSQLSFIATQSHHSRIQFNKISVQNAAPISNKMQRPAPQSSRSNATHPSARDCCKRTNMWCLTCIEPWWACRGCRAPAVRPQQWEVSANNDNWMLVQTLAASQSTWCDSATVNVIAPSGLRPSTVGGWWFGGTAVRVCWSVCAQFKIAYDCADDAALINETINCHEPPLKELECELRFADAVV